MGALRRVSSLATRPVATHLLAFLVGLVLSYRLRGLVCLPGNDTNPPEAVRRAAAGPGLGSQDMLKSKEPCECPVQRPCHLEAGPVQRPVTKQAAVQGVAGDAVSTQLVEAIYWDEFRASQRSFQENGGLKDKKQISAGHGSKIRIWDYHGPFYNCGSRERVGRIGDGGKWVCGVRTFLQAPPQRKCVIYSIGSKGEVSFEVGVQEKLSHCELHVFDPTLTKEQERTVVGVEGAQFHSVGLGVTDGVLEIKGERRRHLSWVQKTKSTYPVKRLATLMAQLGHRWIDILKVDIEGGEWPVFEGLFQQFQQLPATQVQIELHFLDSIPQVQAFFEGMARLNFRVFSVEPNYYGRTAENARRMIEYSFIQVDPSTGLIVQGDR